ncbi:butyrophilin subfamily 1 member A1-like [Scomber japonicus]|uniref:butyrophilin subfamily 1 member A1-like n=1 Tax=Scomber japonicus TaxID=13676 RepID=UPI002306810E|nr:butyrophilin subfamily 1 member A1-like [Scomber japonicus]
MVGDDVVLPCQLEPPADAAPMILEWAKPDVKPRFVFVWRSGQELVVDQNNDYKGRSSLFIDRLKHGDVSLKLSKVKISDEGTYRCYFPKLKKIFFVELLVGAVSSPGISLVGTDRSSSVVVLQCESKGWNPQPEVIWLDDEGNLLSAGPTETIRGPDGLYTVSSRVTVEKKYGNNFTCRVRQDNIYQFRETHIIIPDDFFMAPSSCAASITTSVLFSIMFILAVAIFIWKWRQYKTEKKEEEKNDLEKLIDELIKQSEELVSQKEQIIVNMEKADEMDRENRKRIDVVDKEINEMKGDKTANKAQGYLKLKEIISQVNYIQDKRKNEQDNLISNADKQRQVDIKFNRMADKKKQVENNMEEINEQLEMINRQREEIQKKLESIEKGKK